MMKYSLVTKKAFRKDLKRLIKSNYDLDELDNVVSLLLQGKVLPEIYNDHKLIGDLKGYRECYIKPDWLLVYQYKKDDLLLVLSRTGSHSDILRM